MKYRLVCFIGAALLAVLCAAAAAASNSGDANNGAPGASVLTALEPPSSASVATVHAQFHLLDIQKINDEEESFEFSGVLTLVWQDDRQRFDPAVQGVEEIVFNGAYQFNELAPAWYPQVILANASELQDMQGVLVRVQSDGTSSLVQTINATARSALNLRRYPFDSQRLQLVFQVLGFDEGEVANRIF